ncbi:MAG: hypothetical protein WC325_11860 [Candidatus Bathyarchaeia archaeon]|jgi:hypothetical protein
MNRDKKALIVFTSAAITALILSLLYIGAQTNWAFNNSQEPQNNIIPITPPNSTPYTPHGPYILERDAYVGSDFSVTKITGTYGYDLDTIFYHGNIYVFESAEWQTAFANVTYLQKGNQISIYPL